MGSPFDSRPYKSVRGALDAFTVKQLPFITVVSRPSTASAASIMQMQPDSAAQQAPARTVRPLTGGSAAFSPKWVPDKLRPAPRSRSASAEGTARTGRGAAPAASGRGAQARADPAVAAAFEDNSVLRAAVAALVAMLGREKKLKKDADAQAEVLRQKCIELEQAVEEVENRGQDGGKAWRTNSKKMQNYGPLAPSSVMDPFAEEQRIIREREQRMAEKERRRKEARDGAQAAHAASEVKCAATMMHS
jgi:hypothetical protein